MLESLIITLREGIEISLIIGILLVYLERIGKSLVKKSVYAGLAFAVFVSVLTALILQKLSLDYEPIEGFLMFIAAGFVTFMVIWMWRTGKLIRLELEDKVNTLLEKDSTMRNLSLGIFVFTFLMVVREGVETVIFLRAVSGAGGWTSELTGALGGIILAVVFGVLFVRGSIRIDIARFLNVTAVVLLIFVAQLLINGVHEFYELGIFPPSPRMMGLVGPIVRNNLLFILAIVSIPAIMFMLPGKKQTTQRAPRSWRLGAGIVSLSVIFFLGFDDVFTTRSSMVISPPQTTHADQGLVRIPVRELLDGDLHRYVWVDDEGTRIRFFALRTRLGTFSTAFDACRACYNYGYFSLKNGELICSVCEAPSELSKLAVATTNDQDQSGSMEGLGCAPLYLPSLIQDDAVLVKTSELEKNKKFFQTNLQEMKSVDSVASTIR